MSEKTPPSLPAVARVILSLILPLLGALLFSLIVTGSLNLGGDTPNEAAVQLAGAALVSWFVGWRWYGLKGLGLQTGRPMYAGIGFATLGWLAFFVVRLATVEPGTGADQSAGLPFLYLLLFEAFSSQLWSFGLFFRSVADWRGGLTAAVSSGILFGAIALLFFQESSISTYASLLYFLVWGVLYGVIRLRTGGLLGMVIIQAMQSWTAWQLFSVGQADPAQLRNLYLISSLLYALIIWRLWPRKEEDYRV